MTHRCFTSIAVAAALVSMCGAPAPAQDAYFFAKYALTGYGAIDMGYFCDNGKLNVAVHGEAKGSLSVALGSDAPASAAFDGTNSIGPDGYYKEAHVSVAAACDQRESWPPLTITSSTGQNLTIHWP